ncbi:MAG TPA: hypothetical protein ENN87_03580 [Phycisphaerales bacterium]|nr:hypothetical protein [Phycisphaerales bacterium]
MHWKTWICGVLMVGVVEGAAWGAGFSWKDTPGKYLDLLYDGRRVTRYMYDYDESDEQRTFETYKVFHHVFDERGEKLLTNGPDGEHAYSKSVTYPHHRGLFIGWNRLRREGRSYDTWHMTQGVRQLHQRFLERTAGADQATAAALIHWTTGQGTVLVEETRTTTVHRPREETVLLLDFKTQLKAVGGEVHLDGDPEHAGFQYRPHDAVAKGPAEDKAKYLFPREGMDPREDKDLPWVAMSHGLDGKRYTVIYMNHPSNPKGAIYSAYRDYGRFGAFFTKTIEAGRTLTLHYRVLVMASAMPARGTVERLYGEYLKETDVEGGANR